MNFDWNKKVGPLPLWAWVGVVGIGLIFSYYTYNKNGGFTKTPSDTETPTDVENTSPTPGVGTGGMGWQYVNPSPAVPSKPTVETNEQWGKLATDDLVAQGFDPALVDKAIRNYLGGNPLSAPEQSVINIALRKYGAPPTALPPVINPPSDDGNSNDDPFKNRPQFVIVGASSPGRTNIRDITREFYGSDDLDAKIESVWAWNWDQVPIGTDPNNLIHGTKLRLPIWGPYAPADSTRGMRIKDL